MKKILFATSEAVPFIKTGGLADVAGSLPKCFDKKYFDVRVVLPKYMCMKEEWKNIILLVDSTENIQRLRWERWYRAKLDDKNGLLLGAFAGQCVLNVNGVTPWKKQKQQFGYLVQNGTEIEIKYLFD